MSTVTITINGNDVTDHVRWPTARFLAKCNGAIGECELDIRDLGHDQSFLFGQEVVLEIDGIRRWGGWIDRLSRTYPLPVMLTGNPAVTPRYWHLVGVDFNAFFDKRIVHDSDHPDKTWNYAAGTSDETVINDIWNYIDHEGFTKSIESVATAVLDIPGVTGKGATAGLVASGGYAFRDVMSSIIRNTAAIYYASPSKVIRYTDSEGSVVSYRLSDTPSDEFDIGYREARIGEDSTDMCNDALVWGAGYGTNKVVFARREDSGSISSHGRWQAGQFSSGVYKQTTADAIAVSYVEGSPAAHRAEKYPKRSVDCVVFSPAFSVGDVVDVTCATFSYHDQLPIRQMEITFPTPTNAKFALHLSWEIDTAWSMFDPWRPTGGKIGGGGGPIGGLTLPSFSCGAETPFDDFNRVVADGFGNASSGPAWTIFPPAGHASVDGAHGVLVADEGGDSGGSVGASVSTGVPIDTPIQCVFEFQYSEAIGMLADEIRFDLGACTMYVSPHSPYAPIALTVATSPTEFPIVTASYATSPNTTYGVRLSRNGSTTTGKIWIGTFLAEPAYAPQLSIDTAVYNGTTVSSLGARISGGTGITGPTMAIDQVLLCGLTGDDGPTDVVGKRICEPLTPLSTTEDIGGVLTYPSGSHWKTVRASYVPGSTNLTINGVGHGGYIEYDPAAGIISISFDVVGGDAVILCYISNGALP